MTNIIELKTLHFIQNKPVYCDVMTEYGLITISYTTLQTKASLGEVSNCEYKNNTLQINSTINKQQHDKAIVLYHISFDKPKQILKTLSPRIPGSAADLEDNKTSRVCFSDSIAGALSSISDGVDMLSDGSIDDIDGENNTIYVGRITVGNNDKRLVGYNQLYNSALVFDALSTHEYWWKENSILVSFSQYIVEEMEETFHYIVTDDDREKIANEFEHISPSIANKIRSLAGDKLYNYINNELTSKSETKNVIGNIMFNLNIDDIAVALKVEGIYKNII